MASLIPPVSAQTVGNSQSQVSISGLGVDFCLWRQYSSSRGIVKNTPITFPSGCLIWVPASVKWICSLILVSKSCLNKGYGHSGMTKNTWVICPTPKSTVLWVVRLEGLVPIASCTRVCFPTGSLQVSKVLNFLPQYPP